MGYIRRKKRNCSNFLRPFFPFFSRICATSCALEMSFLLSCVGKRKAPSIFTSPGLPYKSSFFPERKYSKGTFLVCLVNCDWLLLNDSGGLILKARHDGKCGKFRVVGSRLIGGGRGGDPSTRIWHFGRRKTLAEMTKGCKSDSLLFPKNTTNLIGAMPNRAAQEGKSEHRHKTRGGGIKFSQRLPYFKIQSGREKTFLWEKSFFPSKEKGRRIISPNSSRLRKDRPWKKRKRRWQLFP